MMYRTPIPMPPKYRSSAFEIDRLVVSIHDHKKRVVGFRLASCGQVILAGLATENKTEKMSGWAFPVLLLCFCPVWTQPGDVLDLRSRYQRAMKEAASTENGVRAT